MGGVSDSEYILKVFTKKGLFGERGRGPLLSLQEEKDFANAMLLILFECCCPVPTYSLINE